MSRLWDVVGVGECSIDEVWRLPAIPAPGAKLRSAARERLGGGQIASAMVACSRLGLRAAYAGAVGEDAEGAAVIAGLQRENVDVSGVRTLPGSTRSALVLVDEQGERTVIEHLDKRVVLPEPPAELISQARLLHLDATQVPLSLKAARLARQARVTVSIDVDYVGPGVDELISLSDVCITSANVPSQLTGEADLERALLKLATLTEAKLLCCTLGARGAAAVSHGRVVTSQAFAVEVVDTTACGDTFHAAAIRALLDGKGVADTLRFANAAAALKCRALGRRGCPTLAEVDQLIAQHQPSTRSA